jgi:predicted transcriptional regulator
MSDDSDEVRRAEKTARHESDDVDRSYAAYVKRAIEAGIADSEAGRTVSVEDIRAEYGLS